MRCQEAEVQLLLCRSDDDLAARPALGRHVAQCPRCRAAWEEARALNQLLADLPADVPDEGFAWRVLDRVRQEEPLRPAVQGSADRRRFSPAAIVPRLTDWALAMATTFAVFTLGFSLALNSRVDLTAQAGPGALNAVSSWFPRLGWLMVDYAQQIVALLGAS
ncbi:MAG: hypothetical protein ACM3ZA_05500 [Bacillota bacterium]